MSAADCSPTAVVAARSPKNISGGGSSALVLAWLVMCAQQLILTSPTLSGGAFESALSSLVACVVWFALSRASSAVGASPGPAGLVACGVASSVAGVLLVVSPGGSWSYLLLFAHVALGCEVVARALAPLPGLPVRPGSDAPGAAGAGLVCAAVVHGLARAFAGLLGSAGNVGFYAQVSVVFVSLLPAAAAIAWALSSRRRLSHAPAESCSSAGRFAAVPGVAALVALFGLFACMAMAFCGVVASPYQIDMLACGDWVSIALVAVGAIVWACARVVRVPGFACSSGLALLSIAGMLGGIVSYAVAADPVSPLPLAAVQAAGACLLAAVWALLASAAVSARRARVLAVVLVAIAVPVRFLGFAVKHVVGLDAHTVVVFALVGATVLAVVLLASVLAVAVSSQRALREAESEAALAVEGMRHDPGFALNALHQIHCDALGDFGLSEREAEIAALAIEGNSANAIAEISGISPNTVRFHLRNAYSKAKVNGKEKLREKVDEHLSQGNA